jgi:hypothetical protein
MKKIIPYLFLLLFLTACPGATSYKPMGFTGGFSETQISKDRYKIYYKANAFVGSEIVENRAMLRAAEFTLEVGKDLFAILTDTSKQTLSGSVEGGLYTKHGRGLEIKVFNYEDYFPNTNLSNEEYKVMIEKRNKEKGDTNLYIAEDVSMYLQKYK